jgi:hypothetical protein
MLPSTYRSRSSWTQSWITTNVTVGQTMTRHNVNWTNIVRCLVLVMLRIRSSWHDIQMQAIYSTRAGLPRLVTITTARTLVRCAGRLTLDRLRHPCGFVSHAKASLFTCRDIARGLCTWQVRIIPSHCDTGLTTASTSRCFPSCTHASWLTVKTICAPSLCSGTHHPQPPRHGPHRHLHL